MRIVFYGTPEIAVPFLEFLYENEEVVTVITQPDKEAGRGMNKLKMSPVKLFVQEVIAEVITSGINLPLSQPVKINELIEPLSKLSYDLGVVVAYGKILPLSLIKTAKLGYLNVHFSLLPKYRGAAPVQWAIINGEKETGVTVFWLDAGMDTGEVVLQRKIAIEDTDTVNTLIEKLILLGIGTLKESIKLIRENSSIGEVQVGETSYAPVLKKEDGLIDWNKEAREIYNLIRGTQPWPGAYTTVSRDEARGTSKILKIIEAKSIAYQLINLSTYQPGSIVGLEKNIGFVVKCKDRFLLIKKVQEEGKKAISAWDWWQGARLKRGDHLNW